MNKEDFDNFTVEDSRKWGILSAVAGLAVYILAMRYVTGNKASLCALFVAMTIFLVRFYWRLKAKIWFWTLISAIFTIDSVVVAIFPSGKWINTMVILLPIAAIQLAISIFLVSTIDSTIQKKSASH